MQIGDIPVADSLLNAELRIGVLERLFDFILNNNYSLVKPTQHQIEEFKMAALSDLQTKYPNMGIQSK